MKTLEWIELEEVSGVPHNNSAVMGKLTYLACPYSHPNPFIRWIRFQLVTRIAGELMQRGDIVYSPISHGHPISSASNFSSSYEFWARQNYPMIEQSYQVLILTLRGSILSHGVRDEIQYAEERNIPCKNIAISDFLNKEERQELFGRLYKRLMNVPQRSALLTSALTRLEFDLK